MVKNRVVALIGLLLATPLGAAVSPYTTATGTIAERPTCDSTRKGRTFSVTDSTSATACSTGGGSNAVVCWCDGSAWGAIATIAGGVAAHTIDGASHTLSGSTDGFVLQATSATTFEMDWVRLRSHATDCTSLTDGEANEVCIEQDSEFLYSCQPTAGGCDTAAEWILTGDGGGGGGGDITDVWSATTGNVNALTAAAGDSLDAGSADASSPSTRSASLPGTCTEGQFHQDTDSGGIETYICTATNTWVKIAGIEGDIAAGSLVADNAVDIDELAGVAAWDDASTKATNDLTISGVEVDFEAGGSEGYPRLAQSTTPPAGDCDASAEAGRLYADTDADTDGSVFYCRGTAGWKDIDDDGTGGSISVLHVVDEKAANTAGGTFTSGSWQTRTLNTEKLDEIGSTLSSNQFTLPSGTYNIRASAPGFKVDRHQTRLRNITDGTNTLIGTSEISLSSDGTQTISQIVGRFTIAATKTFEIQHRGQTTQATQGFGVESNFGEVETYTVVWIEKLP